MKIGWVLLDAGGTLIDPYPSVGEIYRRTCARFGLEAPPEALGAAFRGAWTAHTNTFGDAPVRYGQDTESTHGWWRTLVFDVLQRLAFEGDREACFRALFSAFEDPAVWRVYDDVWPLLRGLDARGIPVGLVSNWDYRLPPLLQKLQLPLFEPQVISCFEGVAKPDPELYRRALARVGLPPENVAYVGDHAHLDLEPAQKLGLQAFLIQRDRPTGGHSLNQLSDLLALL